jgi:hypothetical protein
MRDMIILYLILFLILLFGRRRIGMIILGFLIGLAWEFVRSSPSFFTGILFGFIFVYSEWGGEVLLEKNKDGTFKIAIGISIPGILIEASGVWLGTWDYRIGSDIAPYIGIPFSIIFGYFMLIYAYLLLGQNYDKLADRLRIPAINIPKIGRVRFDGIPSGLEKHMKKYLGPTVTDILLEKWKDDPPKEIIKKSNKVLKEIAGKDNVFKD